MTDPTYGFNMDLLKVHWFQNVNLKIAKKYLEVWYQWRKATIYLFERQETRFIVFFKPDPKSLIKATNKINHQLPYISLS